MAENHERLYIFASLTRARWESSYFESEREAAARDASAHATRRRARIYTWIKPHILRARALKMMLIYNHVQPERGEKRRYIWASRSYNFLIAKKAFFSSLCTNYERRKKVEKKKTIGCVTYLRLVIRLCLCSAYNFSPEGMRIKDRETVFCAKRVAKKIPKV